MSGLINGEEGRVWETPIDIDIQKIILFMPINIEAHTPAHRVFIMHVAHAAGAYENPSRDGAHDLVLHCRC